MSSSVFREPVEQPKAEASVQEAEVDASSPVVTHVPELLATYSEDMGHPYTADYFEVPDMWKREENLKYEVETIEGYLQKQVSEGKLNNSTKAAKDFLKSMEKEAKIQRFDSPANRISKLVAFIEFKNYIYG